MIVLFLLESEKNTKNKAVKCASDMCFVSLLDAGSLNAPCGALVV